MIRVETEHSIYLVDLDGSRVKRLPYIGGDLRLDNRWVPLLGWNRPGVGEPMVLALDILGNGVETVRVTSLVTSLASVSPSLDNPAP